MTWSQIKYQLTSPQPDWWGQLIKYCLSGGLAFVVDFGLLWLLKSQCGLHYLLAAGIAYVVGLVITYTLSIWWIFDERRLESRTAEITLFVLIGLCGLGLTQLCMWIGSEWVFGQEAYLLSKIVTTVIVSLFNFFMKKYILFTSSKYEKI